MPAYNFEPQKKSARNLILSANSQLAAGTVFADLKLTRRIRFDGAAVLEQKPTRIDDKDMSGKGTEFATENQITNWDASFSVKGKADDWWTAWALAFVMGADTLTAGPPAVHAFAFDETTTQAKMTNLYLEDTADVKAKYPDFAVSDLTLSYAGKGAVGLEVALISTGRWTDGAMAALPALPTDAYFMNADTVFSLGPFGAPVSMVGRFMSATLKISSGVVSHTAPGGGEYGIFMRTGLRKFSLQAVVAAKDTDDIRTLMNGDTMAAISIVTTSGALPSILDIEIPKFKLKANKLGVDGNMVTWAIELDETTALKVVGEAPVDALTATVTNTQATAYLVGV